jgi:outer membrane immunogenic protein
VDIRKILLAAAVAAPTITGGTAFAADLSQPYVAPPATPAPQTWTGLYLGVHGGYGWGTASAAYANSGLTPAQLSPDGWLGGAQIGYNYQFSSGWVAGIEGDYTASSQYANQFSSGNGGGNVTIGQSIDWLSTLRLRLGYSMGRWLPYVTGGVAFGGGTRTEQGNFPGSDSRAHTGWAAGVGAEYALTKNWSVRGEYRYYDLGTQNYDIPGPGGQGTDVHLKSSVVLVGLNYKF